MFFCQGHVDTCLPCRPRGAHYQAEKQVSGGNLLARTALKTPVLMQSHVKECIYFRIYEHDTSLHASSRARGDDIVLNTIMSALFLCLFFLLVFNIVRCTTGKKKNQNCYAYHIYHVFLLPTHLLRYFFFSENR